MEEKGEKLAIEGACIRQPQLSVGFVSGPFATPHCNEADGRQLRWWLGCLKNTQVVQKWTKAY